jgi:mRNA interferase MazF
VSHDGFNETPAWKSIIVVPVSSSHLRTKHGPTIIGVPGGAAGLPKPSVAVCHQVTTLDRTKLTRRIGTLPAELLNQVTKGLRAAMDLD